MDKRRSLATVAMPSLCSSGARLRRAPYLHVPPVRRRPFPDVQGYHSVCVMPSSSHSLSTMMKSFGYWFAKHCVLLMAGLVGLVVAGCGAAPEASFSLADQSRLPKWFKVPAGQSRASVMVSMDYFNQPSGRTAEFTLRGSDGKTIEKVTGNLRGLQTVRRPSTVSGSTDGYPLYEVITIGDTTEVIEHRKMEPVFYVSDDTTVLAELGVQH